MARKQGNPPTIHIVEAGDTLFDLAQVYYGNGNLSTNISAANGNINPQNLQIGQRLQIPAVGASSSNTGNVVIYNDSNYRGFSQNLTVGRYDWGQIRNDSISSLRVPPGMKVTLYSDTRFGGKTKTFTQDTPYVGDDFNDQTSSIIVESATVSPLPTNGSTNGYVVVYDDSNYRGFSQNLTLGRYDWGQIRNDSISSLRVPLGMKVTLYSDTRFGGKTKTFTQDTPYVGDDFNDQTSSIIVEYSSSSGGGGKGFVNIVSRSSYESMFPNRNRLYSYDGLVIKLYKGVVRILLSINLYYNCFIV